MSQRDSRLGITLVIITLAATAITITLSVWRTSGPQQPTAAPDKPSAAADTSAPKTRPAHWDIRPPSHPAELAALRARQRADENGRIPPGAHWRAIQQRKALRRAQIGPVADAGIDPTAWTWLGPGNIGGRIRSILIHPTDTDTMWIGSVSGGIWKTTNGGTSWFAVDDFMANLAISTMVMHPSGPDTIYVGTGEGFFNVDAVRGAGVFECTDGGINCTQLPGTNTSDFQRVNRLTIDPDDPLHILAATNNGIYETYDGGNCWAKRTFFRTLDVDFHPTAGIVFSSGLPKAVAGRDNGTIMFGTRSISTDTTNCGPVTENWTSWTPATLTGNIAATTFVSVATDPTNSSRDLLTVGSTNGFVAGEPIMIGTGTNQEAFNVQRIVDGTQLVIAGQLANAHPAGDPIASIPVGRVETAYFGRDTSGQDIVYATINTGQGAILRSTDGGRNFTVVSRPGHMGGQGWYNQSLWVDPTDPNTIVFGGIGLWRSPDGGTTIEDIGCGSHADQHAVVHHPNFNGILNRTVFIGNDGGIYRTDDIYADEAPNPPCDDFGWTSLNNGLGITQFYGGAVSPTGKIIGGTQDNRTPVYQGGVNSWTGIGGGDGGFCALGPENDIFYGEYVNLDIWRSTDNAESVNYIAVKGRDSSGNCVAGSLMDSDRCLKDALFIAPFITDPNDRSTLLAGAARLWRSTNAATADNPDWSIIRGYNWIDPPGTPNRRRSTVSTIAVAPGNSDDVWVGYTNGEIYRTVNGTDASPTWLRWDDIGTPMPGRFVLDIAIDPSDPLRVYVSFGGYNADNLWKLVRTGPGTVDWQRATGMAPRNLPSAPIRSIAVHPFQPGWLYVGTEVGIFASENDGQTWSADNDGPANVSVDELLWQDDTTLLAFTHGRGVYRAAGILPDCDGNGILDADDLAAGTHDDCNDNDRPDVCDIGDTSDDCDANSVPDECQISFSSTAPGGPFFCELDCDPDCNDNGVPDACDIDCNGNGQPDECDLAAGPVNFPRTETPFVEEAPRSVGAGDFDGDGFEDLAVVNTDSSSISVLLSRGTDAGGNWLGFESAVNYSPFVDRGCSPFPAEFATPWALDVADVNNDGHPDIVVASHSGCPSELTSDLDVFLNNGDGTFNRAFFGPVVSNAASFRAEAVATADLDGDGFVEAIVANTQSETGVGQLQLTIAFNAGLNDTGNWRGFTPPRGEDRFPDVGREPAALAVGKFNVDGHVDVASANRGDGNVSVLINDGTGVFAAHVTHAIGGAPNGIAAGDLNGDGLSDLAVADGTNQVAVLLATTTGFASPVRYDTGMTNADAVAMADFDRDGDLDLAFGRGIILNSGEGIFGAPFPTTGITPFDMAVADVDNDADFDIAQVPGDPGRTATLSVNDSTIDCNRNGVPDECEIDEGRPDTDGDGLLDVCEVGACDRDRDGDCDIADYRRMRDCWRGPGVRCTSGTTAAGGALIPDLDGDFDFDLRDFAIFQRSFTAPRDCCLTHGPHCNDYFIETCVCEARSSCCTTAWDETCVALVEELDCGSCAPDRFCGDGTCGDGETCGTCPRDCGPCEGACCEPNGSIGCDLPATQACVCEIAPHCCTEAWDDRCVEVAASTCEACCGDGKCDFGEDCFECPDDCGTCDPVCGNDDCEHEDGENCATCPIDCRPCEGSCCIANPTEGCLDRTVQNCVCALDPACCEDSWTSACAQLADSCGSCNGDCCATHDNPGCTNHDVEFCVCSIEPECCTGSWGETCVQLAGSQCGSCCGDGLCNPPEDCESCPEDCGPCEPVCGDNACNGDETCFTCPTDCGQCTGDCCQANGTPGCEDAQTQDCVCSFDPDCCEIEWVERCATNAQQCNACLSPQCPDLVVDLFEAPAEATLGQDITDLVRAIALNGGDADASGFWVGFYLSADQTITTQDVLLSGGRDRIDSLAAGNEVDVPTGMSVPADAPTGQLYIGVLLDEFNEVDECKEDNNTAAAPITIQP